MDVGKKTHVGNVRTNNEDAYCVRPPLLVVADGMGGHEAGEVAARAAVAALADYRFGPDDGETVPKQLAEAVHAAHRRIADAAAEDMSLQGMGTTVTAAYVGEGRIYIAHVGDSRAYLWRDGRLIRLTDDHSMAGELVRAGQLKEEDVPRHPHRHVLTRAVGAAVPPEVDMITTARRPGDTLLLCTDGLTAHVGDDEIADVLGRGAGPQATAERLVRLALESGGSDNVTVIVARGRQPEVVR